MKWGIEIVMLCTFIISPNYLGPMPDENNILVTNVCPAQQYANMPVRVVWFSNHALNHFFLQCFEIWKNHAVSYFIFSRINDARKNVQHINNADQLPLSIHFKSQVCYSMFCKIKFWPIQMVCTSWFIVFSILVAIVFECLVLWNDFFRRNTLQPSNGMSLGW